MDIGYNDNVRAFGTISAANAVGTSGTAPATQTYLDHWLSGSTDPNVYTAWGTEFAELRYAKMKFTATGITSTNVNVYTQFDFEMDRAENTTQGGSVAVSSAGTTVSFPLAFHAAPAVTATAQSTAALTATASPITSSDFFARVFTSSGAAVAATISWTAIGE